MGKKRKRDEENEIEFAESIGTIKKRRYESYENGDEPEEFYVWLIQKPKNVPLEELSDLNFPHKPKSNSTITQFIQVNERNNNRRSSLGKEQANKLSNEYECCFEKPVKPMYHVHTKEAKTAKELRNLRPSSKIRGIVTIRKKLILDDGFPLIPEEDFLAGTYNGKN